MLNNTVPNVDDQKHDLAVALAIARDVVGWSEEELKSIQNAHPNEQRFFVMWLKLKVAAAAEAANDDEKDDDKPLMQKISGPPHINNKDFLAIILFQDHHPELFTDPSANDMCAQIDTFNRLFEGPYANEFKTILREI